MPGSLLTFLKYIFLAVLYLFFLRVLRAVWIETREPRTADGGPEGDGQEPAGPEGPGGFPTARGELVSRLVVVSPPERAGQGYRLDEELTVGRAPGCGVPLGDDTFVSQLHARVFHRDGEYFVEDLGSTNGTFLNDQKVGAPVALRSGDRLQVGKTVMELDR